MQLKLDDHDLHYLRAKPIPPVPMYFLKQLSPALCWSKYRPQSKNIRRVIVAWCFSVKRLHDDRCTGRGHRTGDTSVSLSANRPYYLFGKNEKPKQSVGRGDLQMQSHLCGLLPIGRERESVCFYSSRVLTRLWCTFERWSSAQTAYIMCDLGPESWGQIEEGKWDYTTGCCCWKVEILLRYAISLCSRHITRRNYELRVRFAVCAPNVWVYVNFLFIYKWLIDLVLMVQMHTRIYQYLNQYQGLIK